MVVVDGDLLEEFFFDGAAGAVHGGAAWFEAADASPDDAFAPVVVPVDAPVELAALPADDHLGEAVVSRVDAFLTVRPGVDLSAPHELRLHLHEDVLRNDGLMSPNWLRWHSSKIMTICLL